MRKRRDVLAFATLPFFGSCASALANAPWPTRPIRIVVAFPPGGSLDALARLLTPQLSSRLGATVFIENKPGAIGTIGNQLVAQSPPDGYTFLATVVASYTTTVKMLKVHYDAFRDLPPVSIFATGGQVFVASASSMFRSLDDIFGFARAKPGALNFGIIGKGTQDHIAGEFLRKAQNLQWEYIPFNGTGPLYPALMAGDIHLSCMASSAALPHIRAGSMIALATAGKDASPFLPGVPPAGLPTYVSDYTYALAGPRGLPQTIVARLQDALTATLADPAFREALESRSLSALFNGPDESARMIREEADAIAPLLASMDLRIE